MGRNLDLVIEKNKRFQELKRYPMKYLEEVARKYGLYQSPKSKIDLISEIIDVEFYEFYKTLKNSENS
jgi:hypothetical protein